MSQRHAVKVGHGTLTSQVVGNTPFRAARPANLVDGGAKSTRNMDESL